MKHKFLLALTALGALTLLFGGALAEDVVFDTVPDVFRPGRTERISFTAAQDCTASLTLLDEAGQTVAVLRENISAVQGGNHLSWDGMTGGQPVAEGQYTLRLTAGDASADKTVTVGTPAPRITGISASAALIAGESWTLRFTCSVPGETSVRIRQNDEWLTLETRQVPAGETTFVWDGKMAGEYLPSDDYSVQITLTDETDFAATPQQITLTLSDVPTPTPIPTATPAPTPYLPSSVTTQEEETSYWTLPIGETDEQKIWDIMMQPITVLEGGQRDTIRVRQEPSTSSPAIGEITCASQGVHVLEKTSDGWAKVEAYNSSYGPDNKNRPGYGDTDELLVGYVKASLLKEITPVTSYGLLIDKLTQQMYIFQDGKKIGTLWISTGEPTAKQPWNETPSGEFLMVSRAGGFPAGNLWCDYGMRINGGCLIHEVPYKGDENTPNDRKDYSYTLPYLGFKASHGCIRVQKAANEEGQNILWLWKNIKVNTKVLIWDDTGRRLEYPADDTEVYYNPEGGKYFHQNQNCSSVKDRFLPLTATTYGELETLFGTPTRCPYCCKLKTKAEIDAINASLVVK